MEYYGYSGKTLHVNLSNGKIDTEPTDMDLARKFIGGCGTGERMLCDMLKPGTDPFSAENPVIICAGPLIGTGVPGASKIEVLTKSAASASKDSVKHFIPRSSGGSRRFGVMMKRAGYDQIVITGKADGPVYLKILDDDVEICPADDFWGKKDIYETSDALTERYKDSGVIAIGRAGENRIPYSIGWIDKQSHIGRNGGAPVMGSKNLKAIAVHGTGKVNVRDRAKLKTMAADAVKKAMESPRYRMMRGMTSRRAPAPPRDSYYPPDIASESLVGRSGCYNCVFTCKPKYVIRDGEFAGGILGSSFHYSRFCEWVGIEDYRHALRLVEICDRAGIDFRTIIAMLRFINRLYERSDITTNDIDGLEIKRGDTATVFRLVEKIINREGIGDIFANGWFAMSETLGIDPDTDKDGYYMVKGCSSFFDALTSSLNPVTFAEIVNTKPGAELHPATIMPNQPVESIREWGRGIGMSPEELDRTFGRNDFNTGRLTKHAEDVESVYWAMGTCVTWAGNPPLYSLETFADLYKTVTGIEVTADELKKKGERIWNTGKLLNTREGIDRSDDRLPGQWANAIGVEDNPLRDYFGRPVTHAGYEKMLDDYYDEHGWDIARGIPVKSKLIELGLEDLAHMLDK